MTTAQIAALAEMRTSTSALVQGLDAERWSDAEVREPSVLPGWTRGHVLTHLARNADGISRTLAGALRGEIVARYPGGREGRDADIEAGAGRPVLELLADVRESAERLDRVFAAVVDSDAWNAPTEDRPAGDYAVARWREVEVHRVDLGGTYRPSDWPPRFVAYVVPDALERLTGVDLRIEITADGSVTSELPGRTWTIGAGTTAVTGPDWAVAAWAIGRAALAATALSATPDVPAWL